MVLSQSQPVVQAEGGVASGPSLTTGTGHPDLNPRPSIPAVFTQQSSRIWHSGGPYHPLPANHDGDHWKRLYEKAERFDKEFCEGWNSEIDSLLTFAGLFSAVVTAFAVESYKLLQPNPQDMTNRILLNLTAHLTGRNIIEPPLAFSPSVSSLRINTLWFLSLTFSLTAGLVGILCKQWLRHYQQDISKPPKEALAFRQFRYDSFLRCRVTEILNVLPILLGLGLILFFIGLIDFLQGLTVKVSIPVTVLIGADLAFLVVTTLAPAFQYYVAVSKGHSTSRDWDIDRPLFAFKSPQSLAILHLITWLFPLSEDLKVSNWASLELNFFSGYSSALRIYTERALTWLDETYSHSLDAVHQICLCLQDIEGQVLEVECIGGDPMLQNFAQGKSRGAAIKSLFNTTRSSSGASQVESLIAMRYLPTLAPVDMSFAQKFTVLKRLIQTLNSTHRKVPSFEPFRLIFVGLSTQARDHPAEFEEVIWQREILFRNLLLKGQWTDSAEIPLEVCNVFKNLKIFSDEDLGSIFDALCGWMYQHPQDVGLPSHCWAALTAQLKPHERLDEAVHRPPVRNFMAFLDSQLEMGEGVKYMCSLWYYGEEALDSFFKALYAWIKQNPQNTQSFIHCRALLTTANSWHLERMRDFQSFCDFEAFLEVRIARNKDVVEQGPVRNM